jgi:hypothetical protein
MTNAKSAREFWNTLASPPKESTEKVETKEVAAESTEQSEPPKQRVPELFILPAQSETTQPEVKESIQTTEAPKETNEEQSKPIESTPEVTTENKQNDKETIPEVKTEPEETTPEVKPGPEPTVERKVEFTLERKVSSRSMVEGSLGINDSVITRRLSASVQERRKSVSRSDALLQPGNN